MFRNTFLTGACGGLGQALARQLLAAGGAVALVGLDRARLQALQDLAPERCRLYTPDVSDAAAMQAVAVDWQRSFGTPDLVIANAGVAGGFDSARAEDLAVMRRMLEINLLGVACTFQPWLAAMQAAGRGRLVGIASLAGRRGLPGNGAYCASKAGLIHLTRRMALRLIENNIVVSAIAPGAFASEMNRAARDHEAEVAARIPAGRIGVEDDMAGAAIYLASRAGDYVVGATLVVDGAVSLARN